MQSDARPGSARVSIELRKNGGSSLIKEKIVRNCHGYFPYTTYKKSFNYHVFIYLFIKILFMLELVFTMSIWKFHSILTQYFFNFDLMPIITIRYIKKI